MKPNKPITPDTWDKVIFWSAVIIAVWLGLVMEFQESVFNH